jgi:uncharacterized membrane protein
MREPGYKLYLLPVLIILAGGLGLWFSTKISISWLSIIIAVVCLIVLLVGLHLISNLADAQLSNYYLAKKQDDNGYRYQPSTKKQSVIYNFFRITVTVMVFAISLSGSKVENYLHWKDFIVDVLVFSGICAFIICRVYQKRFKIKFDKHEREDHLIVGIFLFILLGTFHLMIWYNHLQPSPVVKTVTGMVTSKGKNMKTGSKYIHLAFGNTEQRFKLRSHTYDMIEEGDSVIVDIKKGALGYSFLDGIKPIKAVR